MNDQQQLVRKTIAAVAAAIAGIEDEESRHRCVVDLAFALTGAEEPEQRTMPDGTRLGSPESLRFFQILDQEAREQMNGVPIGQRTIDRLLERLACEWDD